MSEGAQIVSAGGSASRFSRTTVGCAGEVDPREGGAEEARGAGEERRERPGGSAEVDLPTGVDGKSKQR